MEAAQRESTLRNNMAEASKGHAQREEEYQKIIGGLKKQAEEIRAEIEAASNRNAELKESLEEVKRQSQQQLDDVKRLSQQLAAATQREAELNQAIDEARRNTQQCEEDLLQAMAATKAQFQHHEERQAQLVRALEEARNAVLKATSSVGANV